jgi:hypothetical protein
MHIVDQLLSQNRFQEALVRLEGLYNQDKTNKTVRLIQSNAFFLESALKFNLTQSNTT